LHSQRLKLVVSPATRTGDQAGSIGQFVIEEDYKAGFGFMQENVE
jgi:hypothetical protein